MALEEFLELLMLRLEFVCNTDLAPEKLGGVG
jgi:hypothetical protein